MVKTRSQTSGPAVKKEEHKDKLRLVHMLHSTNNALKNKNKIKKNRSPIQIQIPNVKSESEADNRVIPASSMAVSRARARITKEQITKLIGYIENDKMSVGAAAKKVAISYGSAQSYYQEYQDDPEHKIPLPKNGLNRRSPTVTQQKVEYLIHCVVNDGMNLTQASKKADISRSTAKRYYDKYLEDPDRKTPLVNVNTGGTFQLNTKEQITNLIDYIVRDKMGLVEASKKANVSHYTAKRYYLKYIHNPSHGIPDPRELKIRSGKPCTDEQVKSVIGYIVNDRISLLEASIKANISTDSAGKYYRQYLEDLENNSATPETKNSRAFNRPCTVDEVKNFFGCVLVDKLNVAQAARKAKISEIAGWKYYSKYLKSPINQIKIKDMTYSIEKMKRLVKLVQKEKMNLKEAADEISINYRSARKHYLKYLRNPQYKFPEARCRQYTQDDVKRLIYYIEHNKVSIASAARSASMVQSTAEKYYNLYRNDPEHKIPIPPVLGSKKRQKTIAKYTQIIDDIYKNHPSIKPADRNNNREMDKRDIKVKEELVEEDQKTILKKRRR